MAKPHKLLDATNDLSVCADGCWCRDKELIEHFQKTERDYVFAQLAKCNLNCPKCGKASSMASKETLEQLINQLEKGE